MFFRNLKAYRLDEGWDYTTEQLGELLTRAQFQPCGATDMQSFGWTPPRGIEGEFVVSVGSQQLIALGIEQRLLPGSVVRQYLNERVNELEVQQGYKPGRGQLREIREQVTLELLPRAFTRRRITYVWIDTAGRWLGIDVASAAKADDVIEQLKLALDALPLLPLRTALAPSTAMTEWLAAGEAPDGFTIDRDCELRSQVEEKATVRYSRHNLDVDDVRPHLEQGKKAIRLALTFDDRISFNLTEDGAIKKLAFLDILKEQAEQQASEGDASALFEADFAIMSGDETALVHLIVWPDEGKDLNYEAAMAFAAGVNPDMNSHAPTRHQGIVLFDRLKSLFDEDYCYWLETKTKSGKSAFVQFFCNGGQTDSDLFNEFRVRAVSEIPL